MSRAKMMKTLEKRKDILIVITLLLSMYVFSNTLSKYTSRSNDASSTQVAKWSISINGQSITSSTNSLTQSINLLNSADDTDKIDAGDLCYFDITINPSTTQVSVTYTISVDLSAASCTLPNGTKVEKYEKYNYNNTLIGTATTVNNTSTTITESLSLSDGQTPLGNTDIRKYRVYCRLPNYINVLRDQEYSVTPTITVSQNT